MEGGPPGRHGSLHDRGLGALVAGRSRGQGVRVLEASPSLSPAQPCAPGSKLLKRRHGHTMNNLMTVESQELPLTPREHGSLKDEGRKFSYLIAPNCQPSLDPTCGQCCISMSSVCSILDLKRCGQQGRGCSGRQAGPGGLRGPRDAARRHSGPLQWHRQSERRGHGPGQGRACPAAAPGRRCAGQSPASVLLHKPLSLEAASRGQG